MMENNGKKEKVLIIAYNGLGCSGVPHVIYDVVKNLSSKYDFDIVVFNNDNFYYERLIKEGIKNVSLIRIDEAPILSKNPLKILYYRFFKKNKVIMRQAKKIYKNNHYIAVHSFKEIFSWPYFKIAKKFGINTRIIHNTIDYARKKTLFGRLYFFINKQKTIKLSTQLVSVSNAAGKNAFNNRKFTTIHSTFDNSLYNTSISSPSKKTSFFQIGTFNSNKNQLFSIEVLYYLNLNRNDLYHLYLIGYENENGYESKLIKKINELSLSKNVHIIDGRLNPIHIIEKCYFSILPSLSEGASIVAVEAQACGRHVFASSSLPKDVDCGDISYIDLKDGASNWAKQIEHYLSSLSTQNKNSDLSEFLPDTFSSKIDKLYQGN